MDVDYPPVSKNGFNFVNGQVELPHKIICDTPLRWNLHLNFMGQPLFIHTISKRSKNMDIHSF